MMLLCRAFDASASAFRSSPMRLRALSMRWAMTRPIRPLRKSPPPQPSSRGESRREGAAISSTDRRVLSCHVGASIKAGTMMTVLDDFEVVTVPVSFVYRAGRFLPTKVRAFLDFAAPRLKALGEPDKVEVTNTTERGGMEVASLRLIFKNAVLKGSLYRTPDGKIQQLLFSKG